MAEQNTRGGGPGARAGHGEQGQGLGFHVVENVDDPTGQSSNVTWFT